MPFGCDGCYRMHDNQFLPYHGPERSNILPNWLLLWGDRAYCPGHLSSRAVVCRRCCGGHDVHHRQLLSIRSIGPCHLPDRLVLLNHGFDRWHLVRDHHVQQRDWSVDQQLCYVQCDVAMRVSFVLSVCRGQVHDGDRIQQLCLHVHDRRDVLFNGCGSSVHFLPCRFV